MNIEKLIKKDELEGVEVKTSLSEWKEGIETLAGYAWKGGGKILFGVSNSGKVVGVDIGKGTLEKLANDIKVNTDPKLYPKITVDKVKGKDIVVVETKKISDEPVLAFGRPYKRVGNSTHRMSREEYKRVLFELHRNKLRFDNQVCKEATLDDIDESKLRWFLRTAKTERGLAIHVDAPVMDILTQLELLRDEKLTNTAILLFGKRPQKFFLQAETKCIKLLTLDFVKPYDLYFGYEGTLFDQVDQAATFIMENTRRPLIYGKGVTTKRLEELPEKSIREAIVNATVHRDYYSPSKVQVRIFPDRVEFWNMGLLPEELSVDDLKKPHRSVPRNPLLFKQFYRAGYVEDVGGGTVDIIEKCMAKGLPEPTYEEKQGGLVLTIWRDIFTPDYLRELDLNERQIKAINYVKERGSIDRSTYCNICGIEKTVAHKDLADLVNKNAFERGGMGRATYYILRTKRTKRTNNGQITVDILKNLNDRQQKALWYLSEHRRINRAEYADLCKCSLVTAKRDLKNMVTNGVIERVGKTGRGVYYRLKNGSLNGSLNGST